MPDPRLRTTKKRVQPVRSNAAATGPNPAAASAAAGLAEGHAPAQVAVVGTPAKKASKPARKLSQAIASWWPFAVAIFLTGFAQEWHSMAVAGGVWYERVFFPLSLLAGQREIGLSSQPASNLPQMAILLQLPLEGLWTKFALDRGTSLKMVVAQLIGLHAVCVLVLWLITFAK